VADEEGVIRLLVIAHIIGPELFFYSIAYLLVHPREWTGPVVVGLLGLLMTLLSQALGLRELRRCKDLVRRTALLATQIGGLVGGLAIGLMIYFLLKQ
jgi:hypothetical protein